MESHNVPVDYLIVKDVCLACKTMHDYLLEQKRIEKPDESRYELLTIMTPEEWEKRNT